MKLLYMIRSNFKEELDICYKVLHYFQFNNENNRAIEIEVPEVEVKAAVAGTASYEQF